MNSAPGRTGGGRLAVVTGAAGGIGAAVARRLSAGRPGSRPSSLSGAQPGSPSGAALTAVCVDRDPAVLDTAAGIPGAVGVVADLAAPEGLDAVEAAVDGCGVDGGGVDVLVNCAGITRDALVAKMSEEDYLAVLDVNLGAAWALTERLLPLLADGGAIVNISSRAHLGAVGQLNYAASKGGLVALTRALARDTAPRLRVNAVAPGLTNTAMVAAMPERVLAKLVDAVPMGRVAEPAEIADAVAMLADPAASYVTGQVLLVCGGRSL